ncbi:MAG: hypothetical protein IRZ05_10265 [Micromonosporaceae bacterium]|nr:hypothetical protein [Micromonosporaceae bacterium]
MVFEEINNLPLHPLVVHGAVVLIPLLVLGAVVYAVAPRLRPRVSWAVVTLAVAAPLAALFAKLSGDAFRQRLIDRNALSGEVLNRVNDHRSLGNITLWLTIALGVVTLLFVLVTSRRSRSVPVWSVVVVGLVVVGLAAVSGYYVFQTGDHGARAVWEGF